jgi:hypothetical protein
MISYVPLYLLVGLTPEQPKSGETNHHPGWQLGGSHKHSCDFVSHSHRRIAHGEPTMAVIKPVKSQGSFNLGKKD